MIRIALGSIYDDLVRNFQNDALGNQLWVGGLIGREAQRARLMFHDSSSPNGGEYPRSRNCVPLLGDAFPVEIPRFGALHSSQSELDAHVKAPVVLACQQKTYRQHCADQARHEQDAHDNMSTQIVPDGRWKVSERTDDKDRGFSGNMSSVGGSWGSFNCLNLQ